MSAPSSEINRFERILFRVALALGGLLIAARLGTMVLVWYSQHIR